MPIDLPAGAPDWLIALVVVAGLAHMVWDRRNARTERQASAAAITEVREQVSNTHSTNLRDDMDAIHDEIRDFRRDHRSDMSDVRAHLRDTDQRQRNFEVDVRALVKRTHPEEVL